MPIIREACSGGIMREPGCTPWAQAGLQHLHRSTTRSRSTCPGSAQLPSWLPGTGPPLLPPATPCGFQWCAGGMLCAASGGPPDADSQAQSGAPAACASVHYQGSVGVQAAFSMITVQVGSAQGSPASWSCSVCNATCGRRCWAHAARVEASHCQSLLAGAVLQGWPRPWPLQTLQQACRLGAGC